MKLFFATGLVLLCAALIAGSGFCAETESSFVNGRTPEASPNTKDFGMEARPQSAIPSYFVELGDYAMLVEKSTQRLYLFDKKYTLVKSFHVTTGQNQGDKKREGDRKTPEGIYFFTGVKEQRELLPKYGVMALPINYPNFIDARLHKKGNGIWLHATDDPERPIKPFDSKGCVVAANEDILELAEHVKLQTTPMVIVDKIEYDAEENIAKKRNEILNLIEKWRTGWQEKNIENYMEAYSKGFRSNGMDFIKWRRYKEALHLRCGKIQVSVSDIKILRHSGHIVVSFIQHYKNNQEDSVGMKRLYLAREENGLKIIGEEWNSLPREKPAMIAKKYSAVKMAKLEAPATPVIPENPAPAGLKQVQAVVQKASFEISQKAEEPSFPDEGLFSKEIDIEDFSVNRQNEATRIIFKLVNKTDERKILSGRLAIVASNKNDNQIHYISYPPMPLDQGTPEDFKDGEWYSIRRFKIVKGTINKHSAGPIKVMVYSQTGKLLLKKEFSATGAATHTKQAQPFRQKKESQTTFVSLRGFRIQKQSDRLAISFDLVKIAQNNAVTRGYVFIVADYGDEYFTFPKDRKITEGLPADFKKGDTFAIRWQKHIQQSLPYSLNDKVKAITVFVFAADGTLLTKKVEQL